VCVPCIDCDNRFIKREFTVSFMAFSSHDRMYFVSMVKEFLNFLNFQVTKIDFLLTSH